MLTGNLDIHRILRIGNPFSIGPCLRPENTVCETTIMMDNPAGPPDESSTGRHIPALDGVRGLAILMVMMGHLLYSNFTFQSNAVFRAIGYSAATGWIGVDLFFVLSGFLITGILFDTCSGPRYFRNFYARRMLRIFPLYYGFLFFVLLITLAMGYSWHVGQLIATLTYTQSLERTLHFDVTTASWVNISLFWTLAIEEQFYAVWPFAVYWLRSRRAISIAACCGIGASLLTRIVVNKLGLWHDHPYILYSWTPSQLDGLFFGALLAMIVRSPFRAALLRWATPAAIVGIATLLIAMVRFPGLQMSHSLDVWAPLWLAAIFTATIGWALKPGSLANHLFSNAILRFFGRYSYGLYVFHFTIYSVLLPMRFWLDRQTGSRVLGLLSTSSLVFVLSVLAALLSYHFYERKFLKLKDRFSDSSHSPKLHDLVPTS